MSVFKGDRFLPLSYEICTFFVCQCRQTTVTQKLPKAQCNISVGNSEGVSVWEWEVGWVTAAQTSPQSASTRVGCQLEPTHMTHLTPPLEPWLEIIGLFLQLNRWHTVPGWMSASVHTQTHTKHTCTLFLSLPLICQRVKCQLSVSCAEIYKQHTLTKRAFCFRSFSLFNKQFPTIGYKWFLLYMVKS